MAVTCQSVDGPTSVGTPWSTQVRMKDTTWACADVLPAMSWQGMVLMGRMASDSLRIDRSGRMISSYCPVAAHQAGRQQRATTWSAGSASERDASSLVEWSRSTGPWLPACSLSSS